MVTMNRRALLGAPLYAALAAKAGTVSASHCQRPVSAHRGLAEDLPGASLVSRRQVRHLGALGTASRSALGRLVCPLDVRPRSSALRPSSEALRTSFRVRLQGHHPVVEGGEVRSGSLDGSLCRGRREILRQHGRASRQFRFVEFAPSSLERARDGSQAGYRRCVARCCAPARPALRRVRASRRQPQLVLPEPPVRSVLAQVRRRL